MKYMNQSFGKIILGIWIGAIASLASVMGWMLPNERSIDVPGEIGGVLYGMAIFQLLILMLLTVVFFLLKERGRFQNNV